SPKFSTPVEKTVEIRVDPAGAVCLWPENADITVSGPVRTPEKVWRNQYFSLTIIRRNESLGRDPRAHRNQGEQAQFLHLVPTHDLHGRRPGVNIRPGAQCPLQGM